MNIGKNWTARAKGMTLMISMSRDRRDARPFTVPHIIQQHMSDVDVKAHAQLCLCDRESPRWPTK